MKKEYVILCVDDEINILKSLERTLHLAGYKVVTAISGPAALDILAKEPVDLAIVDQKMPEMTGVEFLAIIKDQYPHMARIMLSGYSDFNNVVRAVNEGEIFRFLTKPWEDQELKSAIALALERKNITGIVEDLIKDICKMFPLVDDYFLETTTDKNHLRLRLEQQEAPSQEAMSRFLSRIYESFARAQSKDKACGSGLVARQKKVITINISIGDAVALDIDFPRQELQP
jgi:response regulator RpfG family c-di-GMP phosphodiesterase